MLTHDSEFPPLSPPYPDGGRQGARACRSWSGFSRLFKVDSPLSTTASRYLALDIQASGPVIISSLDFVVVFEWQSHIVLALKLLILSPDQQ